LAKEVLEGNLELEDAVEYMDNCLGCQSCVTACPSGVQYGDLITSFRDHTAPLRQRGLGDRLKRLMVHEVLPHPQRFRLAARLGVLGRPFARFLPEWMDAMLGLLPERLPPARPLPQIWPAEGKRRARVALLAGCVQQVLDPDIGFATLRVLARNGVETVTPSTQGCCGGLALHTGATDHARALAGNNLQAFPADVDAIITNAAGCGSAMKEYALLFQGRPEHEAAARAANAVTDVTSFLHNLGAVPPPALAGSLRIGYHDACHLKHAQGVHQAPRALLALIPGVETVTPNESELCCGSAGTYNIERPAIANDLGRRKAANLLATRAQLIATGNIGCATHLRVHLRRLSNELPVLHTVQILDRAYAQTLQEQIP
jgi:glycolate oxidase iron-sulfur subunit